MPRLSDRAFEIVKREIERHYGEDPGDQIERVILLARLESLRLHQGKPMTRIEIWEVLSDIAPDFNQKVLREAEKVDTESFPLLGVSMGVGAVTVLLAAAVGMDSTADGGTTPWLKAFSQTDPPPPSNQTAKAKGTVETSARPQVLTDQRPVWVNFGKVSDKTQTQAQVDPFETAKSIGWQAALKSQNPPHSAQHWGETAALWSSAIEQLEQVPRQNESYQQAQLKKKVYEQNLQEIRARQTEAMKLARAQATKQTAKQTAKGQDTPLKGNLKTAQAATINAEQTPRFSGQTTGQPTVQTTVQNTGKRPEDPLKVAKRYGWQAALASQNAPHSSEKWADISRIWQTALLNLDNIDAASPSYAEAQQVKARYQQNLSEIRDRYQQEQSAAQRIQSLNATLIEMDSSIEPNMTKYSQLKSIMGKLKAIPAGTQAHAKAQEMIANVARRMNEIDTKSSSGVTTSISE